MKQKLKVLLSLVIMTLSINASAQIQDVEIFVNRFYVEVLGRSAESGGLIYWSEKLVSGEKVGADVATGFVFSDEYIDKNTTNSQFVNTLYSAFFGRPADTGGFDGWMEKLNGGTSREDVLNGFLYSPEFDALTRAYGIKAVRDGATPPSSIGGGVEDFVKRFYSVVLGREADAGGLADWVNRLNTKVATGADIATGFVFSDEFDEASKDDVTFLNVLYSAFFNRDADEGGLNGWLDKLEQGTSRVDVLNGFLHSDEFVNLCDAYGILAYLDTTLYRIAKYEHYGSHNGYEFTEDRYSITYTYDAHGNVLSDVSVNNDYILKTTYTYVYDGRFNILKSTSKNSDGYSLVVVNTYDERNNLLTESVKSSANPKTFLTTYTYDANNRMLTLSRDSDSSRYTYDEKGNLISVSGHVANVGDYLSTYTYDGHNNILTEVGNDAWGYTYKDSYSYTYDGNNRLLSGIKTSNNGEFTEYIYDKKGNIVHQVDHIVGTNNQIYDFTYDNHGNLLSQSLNGSVEFAQTWIAIPH